MFLIPDARMESIRFAIAGLHIEIETEIPLKINKSFLSFMENKNIKSPDKYYRVSFRRTRRLRYPESCGDDEKACTEVMRTRDFTVYEERDGSFIRVYRSGEDNKPYAASQFRQEERTVKVSYLPEAEKFVSETGNSFFHIEWENILIREQRMMLHAACVETGFGGILFSGPSGSGKSTQAELWIRHRGARMLNGDRTILTAETGSWQAYGSPYAGSSRCYVNAGCGVNAVVFVKKMSECDLRQMGQGEAFQRIYGQLTVNSWDKTYVNRICDMTEKLVREVPVYELSCTPDERAVDILYRELEKRNG